MMSNANMAADASFFDQKMTFRQIVTRRLLRILPYLLVGITVTAGVIHWRSPSLATAVPLPAAQNEPLPVATLQVEHVDSYTRSRHYTGLLHEARRSLLSFQRGGELIELLVDEGQAVAAGQTLGRLDNRHIRANRARLTAQVGEAKAVLDELLAGPRQETIAAKRAELLALQSQSQVLEKQLARRQQLVEVAAVSREEYETFLFDYQAAEARVDVVQRQLDELLAGTRSEQVAAQRARLSQLDAQLTDIAHDLEDTQLVAPFSGRVARRLIDEGVVLTSGSPVLEVIDDTRLEAWIGLPPAATRSLKIGDQYELLVSGETVQATLQSLAPDVSQTTRTRNAIFRLHQADVVVLPGQVVRLALDQQVSQPGYWVPTTALTRGTRGLWSVFVVENSQVARRDVELLDTVGSNSFVRGSLQPAEQIITNGTHRIVVGQQVTGLSLSTRTNNPPK